MLRHADRPHARPAAAVRNAEGLVQIQMADIRADIAGPVKPDLRIHVRAVHVNLPAVLVDDLADLLDRFFEHAMRGRISDHQHGEIFACSSAFARRSATSMFPWSSHATGTTFSPAITALAGLVPCARGRDQADIAMPLPRDS